MVKESVSLEFREGGSDKVYNAELVEVTGGYEVNFSYGRRGSSLTTGSKTTGPVNYIAAKKIYDKLVNEKTGKGYKPVGGGLFQTLGNAMKPEPISSFQARDTGIRPQLLNDIPEKDLEYYLESPEWGAQEKYDGRRRMLIKTNNVVVATNRKGLTVQIDNRIISTASLIEADIVLDGEDMGDYVMIFDCVDFTKTCKERHDIIKSLLYKFDVLGMPAIRCVEMVEGTKAKREFLNELKRKNAEGIVFKKLDSLYVPGRPNSGGDQIKFKFCATASCYVIEVNSTKRSVKLAVDVRTEGRNTVWTEVGNVTVYPNQEVPKVGSVVEVRYLYYFPGGSLFQPVLLGERDDMDVKDCTSSQLKAKREEVES